MMKFVLPEVFNKLKFNSVQLNFQLELIIDFGSLLIVGHD